MQSRERLVETREIGRKANRASVIVRYIQFMLSQQNFARLCEADAQEVVQKSDDEIIVDWWFETEGKKFICFYLFLAEFEERDINVSEMAYQLNKSREFCSRTLAAARRMELLSKQNELPEMIKDSIQNRIFTFLNSRSAHAFVRTAMVRMLMETALVMESRNAEEYKQLRDISMMPENYLNFSGIDDVLSETVNIDRVHHAAE